MGLGSLISGFENQGANVHDLIRVGKITSCNPSNATARVEFQDQDNKESYDLFIIVDKSKSDKDQHSYDVGEDVVCIFMPSGVESGFILGAYYPNGVAKPTGSADVRVTQYSDGTRIEYDRSASKLTINCVGETDIISAGETHIKFSTGEVVGDEITFQVPKSTFTGNVIVVGGISSGTGEEVGSGATIAGPVNFTGPSVQHKGTNIGNNHTHGGVETGGGNTGGPQ